MLTVQFVFRLLFAGLFYSALAIGPVWLISDSLSWPRGWLAIGVLWGTQIVGGLWFLQNDPDLLQERMSPGKTSASDKLATLLIVILLLGWFVGNSLDVHLLHLLPAPPPTLSLFGGLGLFAAGMAIVTWTLRTNTYATSVVNVQEERGQQVIDTGPYAYVRHPMYSGLIPLFAGLSLVMESSAVALFVLPMIGLGFLPRMLIEEQTLRRELEGYDEYLLRTRWRLIPHIF